MSGLNFGFAQFFREMHGQAPFPWQVMLAEQVVAGGWPEVVALPTGSGKTACIDIAIFALAVGCEAARRRIFYIVDRRLVVSEAYQRVKAIEKALEKRGSPVMIAVAEALLSQAQASAECPLWAAELHGGAYRDEGWVRTPLQATVIASTVDQIGSRLLFRGYGVSPHAASIHAGLIANDALILLDEAHASRAFAETLAAVERYRNGAPEPLARPLRFVEMTATPSCKSVKPPLVLTGHDREDTELRRRLHAPKPTELVEVGGKRGDWEGLAKKLAEQAQALAEAPGVRRVAVMCNRVRTARAAESALRKAVGDRVTLVTGRMRPLDREDLYRDRLAHLKSGMPRREDGDPEFVVATQTLEVGADLDFDVLVTEVASLDAILQRFGRLNRMGHFAGARGAIVAARWQVDGKQPDAVYGDALAATWAWLQANAGDGKLEMAIEAESVGTIPMRAGALPHEEREKLVRAGRCAPVLLPAHLDALCQTSPRPEPEPDIALFLHGQGTTPECYLVWRGDLDEHNKGDWTERVEFCPPLAAEALSVRLPELQRWLAAEAFSDEGDTDVEGVADLAEEPEADASLPGVVWRGGEVVTRRDRSLTSSDLQPGDYLVLPAANAEKASALGQIPPVTRRDLGDEAQCRMRRRFTLRLGADVAGFTPEGAGRVAAAKRLAEAEDRRAEARTIAKEFAARWLGPEAPRLARLSCSDADDDAGDAALRIEARFESTRRTIEREVKLEDHLRDVTNCATAMAERALTAALSAAVIMAAGRHDWGKTDSRFQGMLRGSALAGQFNPVKLAKSAGAGITGRMAGLPDGFRHELLSLAMAEKELPADASEREVILHLVASHHGRCRPFAPVVSDPAAPAVNWNGIGCSAEERRAHGAHRLDSGVSERFWSLNRRFGWWGLAYLEALLRMADWEASAMEASGADDE